MSELEDYAGPFSPDVKYEDFSRDMLLELLSLQSDYMQKADGLWYVTVKNRVGDDVAFESDMWVWERAHVWELEQTTKLFKIGGHDVAALFKALQVSPWLRALKAQYDLKNSNYGIWTVLHCPTLIGLEKEGEGREKRICQKWDRKCKQLLADFFDPRIKATALKLPPRKSKDDICCQWEFKLKEA
ncbi:MAG: DUF6125 family protein [Dehalococcoidia bacterium]|nr:DUF6125 family protein [Dehalococcoidia bacterium]